MKTQLILLSLTLLVLTNVFGQSSYYDAVELGKLNTTDVGGKLIFSKNDSSHLVKVLKRLYPNSTTYSELANKFSSNPFIRLPVLTNMSSRTPYNISSINSERISLGSLGGLDVTNIADGIAQFLIERANEEINVWFFQKFKDDLKANEELRTLFPTTNGFIQVTEPYQYAQNLQLLHEAFKKDLSAIIENLETLATSAKYQKLSETNIELKSALLGLAGASIVGKLKKGIHPADVIDSLGQKKYLKGVGNNLYSSVRLLSIASQSLRDSTKGKGYINAKAFKENVLNEKITFQIYLGLLYQELEGVYFYKNVRSVGDSIKIQDVLKNNAKIILDTKDFGLGLVARLNQLENDLEKLRKKTDTIDVKYTDYYKFFNSTIDLVEFGVDANHFFPASWLPIPTERKKEIKNFIYVARQGNEIYKNVNEKNYSLAVLNFSLVYDTLFKKYQDKLKLVSTPKFIKYAGFMAAVAQAETPTDVKAALKAAALPAGSASIKKQTPCNISINSYLGFHWGDEYLEKTTSSNPGWSSIWGVSAPIGIAFSKQLNFPFKNGSISLFTSIIDLGAVVNYRLKDDKTAQLPEIKLENILAPGAYLIYGIPKTPISFGYGWQKGPQLRQVNIPDPNNSGQFKNDVLNGYRWTIFIAVDIPLFNLYTKSK